MAFFSKLKAAFGFGDYNDDEELDEELVPYGTAHRTPYINPFKKEEENKVLEDETKTETTATRVVQDNTAEIQDQDNEQNKSMPDEIFSGILEIINSTIPPFVRECLDIDAERRAIANLLGPQLQTVIADMRIKAEVSAKTKWEQEKKALAEKNAQAESKCKEAEAKAEEAKNKMLAVDLQRKAALERSQDLEKRIATLEAEHEQFELENKSLINKVKVSQVYANDAAHYKEELETLQKNVIEWKAKAVENTSLKEELEKTNTELATAKEIIASMQSSSESVNAEELKKRETELTDKYSGEIAKLQEEIATKDSNIDSLSKKLESTEQELASTKKELDDAMATLDVAQEVQEQIDKLSEQIGSRDKKIASLKEAVANLTAEKQAEQAEAEKRYNAIVNTNLELKLQYDIIKKEAEELKEFKTNANKEKDAAIAEASEKISQHIAETNDLKRQIEILKNNLSESRKQENMIADEQKQRIEDLKVQLETAASLIEQRDMTIKNLNDNLNTVQGEISFSKMTLTENKLLIKKLNDEIAAEKDKNKLLSHNLETIQASNESQAKENKKNVDHIAKLEKEIKKLKAKAEQKTSPEVDKSAGQVASDNNAYNPAPSIAGQNDIEPDKKIHIAENGIFDTPQPETLNEIETIEPELKEAVKHVFKIDISDTAPSSIAEQELTTDSARITPDTSADEGFFPPTIPDAGDQLISNEVIHENDIVKSIQLPIDVIEPASPANDDKENFSDSNINETFENSEENSESGIFADAFNDDIEWLIPTPEPIKPEENTLSSKGEPEPTINAPEQEIQDTKPDKEEHREQQMSLF